MKRHIEYIIFEVSPCKLGDIHYPILKFYDEEDAKEFLGIFYQKWDYNFTCLILMKVLS